ncbi:hypothetical protein [Kocuria carniphila]|uniref:hypothetical protein n=1 Tax=Kocuria carniphila TaxID=262208 RepID=UPI0034DAD973
MNDTESTPGTRRRTLLKAAAWTTPVIVAASAAPAYAASPPNQQFGVVFDGGSGANGFYNTTYLNLRAAATVGEFRSTAPIYVTVDVIGLNTNATRERSFSAGSSDGSIERSSYDAATRTTRLVWTIPAGTLFPAANTAATVPDIYFIFNDGGLSNRITNKNVVRSISGGRIVQPTSLPIDSSVVKDFNSGNASPDGIY